MREKLPEGFQRSEYLLEHGMIDAVVHRRELRDTLIRLIGLLVHRRPTAEVIALPRPDAPANDADDAKPESGGG